MKSKKRRKIVISAVLVPYRKCIYRLHVMFAESINYMNWEELFDSVQ